VKRHENLVTFESMLIAYTDAVARFETGTGDPTTTYVSLFEALNWAVALDDRVGAHWVPDVEPVGFEWRARLGHGAELMAGVRFARNRVHHQWCDAITVERNLRGEFKNWVWIAGDELPPPDKPDPNGEAVYRSELEGRPIIVCLNVLNGAFYTLAGWLEPHTLRQTSQRA
jgi:hypothetical protein